MISISIIIVNLLVIYVNSQLVCPNLPPSLVLKLPEIDPCKTQVQKNGIIETITPNTISYITNATLVQMKTCFADATFYFFGSHVCERYCVDGKLTEIEAKELYHGFCPISNTYHKKFETTYGLDPQCSYTWPKTTSTTTTKCIRIHGHVTYTHLGVPKSTLAHMDHCNYYRGLCQITPSMWVFWDIDERSKRDYLTTSNNSALCDGNRIWFPHKNIGFGLKEYGCDWSDYKETYEGVKLKWSINDNTGKVRIKRSTDTQNYALIEYIVGELQTKTGTFCDTMMGVVSASTLIPHANPTEYARRLLNKTNIIAKTQGSYLFIWYCDNVYATPRSDENCYNKARILYNNNTKAFLEPEGKITNNAVKLSCKNHILVYVLNNKPYVEIGQFTTVLNVSIIDFHHSTSLNGLNPNFTGTIPETHDITERYSIFEDLQEQIITYIQNNGGNINGKGGGLEGVNMPGFQNGWFRNSISSAQSVGTIGGLIFLVLQAKNFLFGRRQQHQENEDIVLIG